MIRIALRSGLRSLHYGQPRFNITNWKIPSSNLDSAGISGFFEASSTPHLFLMQKLSEFNPVNLYHGFDVWTRQLLVTLSSDFNFGLGASIVIATLFFRLLFIYPTMRAQFQGLRNVEFKQINAIYMQKVKISQQTGNKGIREQANYERKMAMKKKGFSNVIPLLNIFQVPILITWFLSLRYMSNLPEIYPQIYTEGFLWFEDLSTYDPYFVLPIAAACLSSLSIIYSPNLARNNITIPFMAPFVKYLKFLPFGSLVVTAFFPASICLYWTTIAAIQLGTTQLMHIKFFKKLFSGKRITQRKAVPINVAVFQEQKKTSEQIMNQSAQKMGESVRKQKQEQLRRKLADEARKSGQKLQTVHVLKTKPKKKKVDQ